MFMGPRNWFQGMNSASLCSLAGRYDNLIPTRCHCLVPIDFLKIPALEWAYGEVIVNSSLGSHIPCFSLDTVSESRKTERERKEEALAAFFSWRGEGGENPMKTTAKNSGWHPLYSFLGGGHKNKLGILPFNFSMVSNLEKIDRLKTTAKCRLTL